LNKTKKEKEQLALNSKRDQRSNFWRSWSL